MAAFVRLSPDRPALAPATRVIAPEDYTHSLTAAELLAEAQDRAAQIAEEAREAFEAEKARGYREGLAEANAEIAERMLNIVTRSVDYLANAEGEVARTVLVCLRKILGDFNEEELVIGAARNALDVVRNEARVTLSVRPEVHDEVRRRVGEILAGHGDIGLIEVVADNGLDRGGCRLETEVGVVDASIDLQVEAIESAMRARIKGK